MKRAKHAAPGLPAWSPTAVLPGLDRAPRTQHKKEHGAGAHSAQRKHRAGQPKADLLPSRPQREPADLAMPTTTIQKQRERA